MNIRKTAMLALAGVVGVTTVLAALPAPAEATPSCRSIEYRAISTMRAIKYAAVRNFDYIKDRAEANINALPMDAMDADVNREIDLAEGQIWTIHKTYKRVIEKVYVRAYNALNGDNGMDPFRTSCPPGHSANVHRNFCSATGWLTAEKLDCLDELDALRPMDPMTP